MITGSIRILKRIVGVILVIFGIIALLIPFFPFAWVAFVGLEFLGIRTLFWDKIRARWKGVSKPPHLDRMALHPAARKKKITLRQ